MTFLAFGMVKAGVLLVRSRKVSPEHLIVTRMLEVRLRVAINVYKVG